MTEAGRMTAPRLKTDAQFVLPAGSFAWEGELARMFEFVSAKQLLNSDLWALFVDQVRSNPDDADKGWRSEYWGKLMRGGCFVYACTRDEALYRSLESAVRDLLTTQDAAGRITTYSPEASFQGWDLWGRKYVLLGLQYFLEICRDEALGEAIVRAMCRHADDVLLHIGPAGDGKLEINEATTHWHGLNSSSILEPMVRLYSLTGEARYLDFAGYIVGRGGTSVGNLFEMAYEDALDPYEYPVTKAYEMMSCFEGLLEYARVTGIEKWRVAVERFAKRVLASDITLIGCSGCTHELFDHSAVRQLDPTEQGVIQETCVTVTWMKVCLQLLCLTGAPVWAEAIEQSYQNALLGAVNSEDSPHNGGLPFDSYSPILPGVRGRKTGGRKEMAGGRYYGCCVAIAAAGFGVAGLAAVLSTRTGLAVNLFQPGTVRAATPGGRRVEVRMETAYPVEGAVRLTLALEQPEALALSIRIPSWSAGAALTVNGAAFPATPGTYAVLERTWNAGDTVLLNLDLAVTAVRPEDYGVSFRDAPYLAFRRGPLVLARDARLGGDVDEPLALSPEASDAFAPAAQPEPGFPVRWIGGLPLADGRVVPLIDYASAGKTWDERSRLAAWLPVRAL